MNLTGVQILEKVMTHVREAWRGLPHCTTAIAPLIPAEYATLIRYLARHPTVISPPFTFYKGQPTVSVYGVPVVVIPFADDPKFKTFQSMAALASAKIHYEAEENIIKSASFISIEHGDTIQYLPCSPALRISRVRRVGFDSMELML